MNKYPLILITEGYIEEAIIFPSEESREAYADGFVHGAGLYGGDGADYLYPPYDEIDCYPAITLEKINKELRSSRVREWKSYNQSN